MDEYLQELTKQLGLRIRVILETEGSNTSYTNEVICAYYKLQDGKQLYIRKKSEYSIIDLYIIARELRIMWQFINNMEYFFYGYRLQGMTEEQIESHISNIDADVFAYKEIKRRYKKGIVKSYKYKKSEELFYTMLRNADSQGICKK